MSEQHLERVEKQLKVGHPDWCVLDHCWVGDLNDPGTPGEQWAGEHSSRPVRLEDEFGHWVEFRIAQWVHPDEREAPRVRLDSSHDALRLSAAMAQAVGLVLAEYADRLRKITGA